MICLLLVACQGVSSDQLQGRILLWHSWEGADQELLDQVLDQFMEINPEVTIVSARIPEEQLKTRYENSAPQGLGPNLIIGKSDWLPDWARQDLIADYLVQGVVSNNYTSEGLREVQIQGVTGLYGLPLSLSTQVLYYNDDDVKLPPVDLNALWVQAESGLPVAIPTNFSSGYWGIYAFGDGLFDKDGQFVLKRSGLAGWLTMMKEAQELSNVVFSRDPLLLRNLFIQGRVSYYVGRSDEWAFLREEIGDEVLGVALLPSGVIGLARPLVHAEVVMLSPASSHAQKEVAVQVARFLTNQEQSTRFMRELGRVPAHQRVEVNRQIEPRMATLVSQTRLGVSLPNSLPIQKIEEAGNLAYANVLLGIKTPDEAVCEFGRAVIMAAPRLGSEEDLLPVNCLAEAGAE
ncbi:MAG TPA: extracellular solute-binding protein [Anaerolineae bacterium]|nr:extracellular solute-binding protein [Anaerolineae bacterium]